MSTAKPILTIDDLNHADRKPALQKLATYHGTPHIFFGLKLWDSLGLKPKEQGGHPLENYMDCRGCELPLFLLPPAKISADFPPNKA